MNQQRLNVQHFNDQNNTNSETSSVEKKSQETPHQSQSQLNFVYHRKTIFHP